MVGADSAPRDFGWKTAGGLMGNPQKLSGLDPVGATPRCLPGHGPSQAKYVKPSFWGGAYRAAVKELKLSCHDKETRFFTMTQILQQLGDHIICCTMVYPPALELSSRSPKAAQPEPWTYKQEAEGINCSV